MISIFKVTFLPFALCLLSANMMVIPTSEPLSDEAESQAVGGAIFNLTERCKAGGNCKACRPYKSCDATPISPPPPEPGEPTPADYCNCTGGRTGCTAQNPSKTCMQECNTMINYECQDNMSGMVANCGDYSYPDYEIEGDLCKKMPCQVQLNTPCHECRERKVGFPW